MTKAEYTAWSETHPTRKFWEPVAYVQIQNSDPSEEVEIDCVRPALYIHLLPIKFRTMY